MATGDSAATRVEWPAWPTMRSSASRSTPSCRPQTKMFCGCRTGFGAAAQHRGSARCVSGCPARCRCSTRGRSTMRVRAALALGCRIHPVSVFARKNYFYPDLPKGYQISQYERPLATGGALAYTRRGREVRVGITRVHLEEDAGKSLHEGFSDSDRRTLRGLQPQRRAAHRDRHRARPAVGPGCRRVLRAAAAACCVASASTTATWKRATCAATRTSRSGRRARRRSARKAEVKNLNSFRFLQRALDFEIARQIGLLERRRARAAGDAAVGRAGGRDRGHAQQGGGARLSLLPRARPAADRDHPARIEAARAAIPELPEARKQRYVADFGIAEADAALLAGDAALGQYFEATAPRVGQPSGGGALDARRPDAEDEGGADRHRRRPRRPGPAGRLDSPGRRGGDQRSRRRRTSSSRCGTRAGRRPNWCASRVWAR